MQEVRRDVRKEKSSKETLLGSEILLVMIMAVSLVHLREPLRGEPHGQRE